MNFCENSLFFKSLQKTFWPTLMVGLTGFEPVMTGSEPVALPLGDSPIFIYNTTFT